MFGFRKKEECCNTSSSKNGIQAGRFTYFKDEGIISKEPIGECKYCGQYGELNPIIPAPTFSYACKKCWDLCGAFISLIPKVEEIRGLFYPLVDRLENGEITKQQFIKKRDKMYNLIQKYQAEYNRKKRNKENRLMKKHGI